jgi:hypothetical protein
MMALSLNPLIPAKAGTQAESEDGARLRTYLDPRLDPGFRRDERVKGARSQ